MLIVNRRYGKLVLYLVKGRRTFCELKLMNVEMKDGVRIQKKVIEAGLLQKRGSEI